MSLINWMLETSFGQRNKTVLTVGLFNGEKEFSDPRYSRRQLRWKLSDGTARTSVQFGPYDGQIEYDRYVIFAGDERVDEFGEEGRVMLPRGFFWDWETDITLG